MLEKQGSLDSLVTSAKPVQRNAFLNWLLVPGELARAEQAENGYSPQRVEFVRRAKLAMELADLLREQGNELRSGSASPLTLDLLRQATHWGLRAQGREAHTLAPELPELPVLLGSSFVEISEMSGEQQRVSSKQLRRFATRLISDAEWPRRQRVWAHAKRGLRVLLLVAVVGAVVGGPWLWKQRDLAKDKPWRTSSSLFECHPDRAECDGVTTSILFHTKLENGPWFQYDFGEPLSFSSVAIRNRTDYAPEAAVPLVIEASNDGAHFKELSRRNDSFLTWRAYFATTHARYLRVRALKETYLHLEAVKVHP